MSAPGFLRVSGTVALKDLRLEWRTGETLAASVVFSMVVLLVFSFAFEVASPVEIGAGRCAVLALREVQVRPVAGRLIGAHARAADRGDQ